MTTRARRQKQVRQPPPENLFGEELKPDADRVIEVLTGDNLGKALWERAVAIATNEVLVSMYSQLKAQQAENEAVEDE